jgi:hypothetical protein
VSEPREQNSVTTKNKTEINCHSSREDKIRYMIEVMQADLDGKEIEYSPDRLSWDKGSGKKWDYDGWNLSSKWFPQYHIKPEEPKKKAVYAVHYLGWEKPLLLANIGLVAEYIKSVVWNPLMISKVEKIVWDGESEFYCTVGDESYHPKPVTNPTYLRDFDDVDHPIW